MGHPRARWASRPGDLSAGAASLRVDIFTSRTAPTRARTRTDTRRQDRLNERSLGAFGEAEVNLTAPLRAVLGLRADYYDWDVSALHLEDSGSGSDALLSPKVSLAYRLHERLEGYAAWGRGFHSNDVRVTHDSTGTRVSARGSDLDVLTRSEGAEIGLRYEPARTFNATLTGFWLELDSELVYVGDAGTTEPSNGSRRSGLELSAFWTPRHSLTFNAAFTLSDARFRGDVGGNEKIPGAIERMFCAGANVRLGKGFQLSIRGRYLGGAPLIEDDSIRSRPSWLVNAGLAYHYRSLEFRLESFNLLDSQDNDIAYFYSSRLATEPVGGVSDSHFHSAGTTQRGGQRGLRVGDLRSFWALVALSINLATRPAGRRCRRAETRPPEARVAARSAPATFR